MSNPNHHQVTRWRMVTAGLLGAVLACLTPTPAAGGDTVTAGAPVEVSTATPAANPAPTPAGPTTPGVAVHTPASVYTNILPALDLLLSPTGQIFSDGFESGNLSRWSSSQP